MNNKWNPSSGAHIAQAISYLKAIGVEVGLLMNYGAESLQYKRLVLSAHNLRESVQSADNQNDPQITQISQMGRCGHE